MHLHHNLASVPHAFQHPPPFIKHTVRFPGFNEAIDEDECVLDGAGTTVATAAAV